MRRWLGIAAGVVALAGIASCGDDDDDRGAIDSIACIEDEVAANEERVPIFKLVLDVPEGTSGAEAVESGAIEADVIPEEYRPSTAVLDLALIEDATAISDLAANQVVVGPQWGITVPPPPEPTSATVCE